MLVWVKRRHSFKYEPGFLRCTQSWYCVSYMVKFKKNVCSVALCKTEINNYSCYCHYCCCRWWCLLLGLLVLRPSISSLLQSASSVITKCDSLFYYKVRWSVITKRHSFFITKYDKCYYKVWQLSKSVTEQPNTLLSDDCKTGFGPKYWILRQLLRNIAVNKNSPRELVS